MYRVCNISKETLADLIGRGVSTRKIAEMYGISKSAVSYNVQLYGLQHLYAHLKQPAMRLIPIDTKEKAYLLGFIIADAHIEKNNKVEVSVAKKDWKTCLFLANLVHAQVTYDPRTKEKSRTYPHITYTRACSDILTLTGGRLKPEGQYGIESHLHHL